MAEDVHHSFPAPVAPGDALADALERAGAADWAAFEHVHRLTCRRLLDICARVLSDRDSAEDALQETYASIWRRASSFDRRRGSAISWVSTIARNQAVDNLRARQRLKLDALGDADHFPDDRDSALEVLLQREVEQRLADSLTLMDAQNRWLVEAIFFSGMTYAHLAAQTGMPLPTVKSRVRRALIQAGKLFD